MSLYELSLRRWTQEEIAEETSEKQEKLQQKSPFSLISSIMIINIKTRQKLNVHLFYTIFTGIHSTKIIN